MDPSAHRHKTDELFAKLALQLGILDQKRLQAAIALQSRQNPPKPLGQILMETGAVTPADMDRILAAQRQIAQREAELSRNTRSDHLFGKVAIRLKFCTEDQLVECLDEQDEQPKDRRMRLGDIMVKRGVLTPAQVRKILDTQRGLILYCPSCDTEYNTVMFKAGASLQCYKCGSPMRIPVRAIDTPADVTKENE